MARIKKANRIRGKGFSHPAVRILILLNVIAWGIGLYIYFTDKPGFTKETQIAGKGVVKPANEGLPKDFSDTDSYNDLSTIEPLPETKTTSIDIQKDSIALITKSSLPKERADTPALKKEPVLPQVDNIRVRAVSTRYTVAKGQAHFHNQPDPSTRRKAFINHWNKAVLEPLDEKNGFVYIVYTNRQGQTSRGWMRIKDLQPLAKR